MSERLTTALVTGASSGIGRATARRLLEDDWHVLALDQSADGLAQLATDLDAWRGQLLTRRCDVSCENSVKEAFAAVKTLTGFFPCDPDGNTRNDL